MNISNPAHTALLHAGQRGTMARQTYLKERWRYQPVWVPAETGADILVVFRCIFDKDNKLRSWTEDMPEGDDAKDLVRDLAWMLTAVYEWKPVTLDALKVGMQFERTGVTVDDVLDHLEHAREFAGVTVAKKKTAEVPPPAAPGTGVVHDAYPFPGVVASLTEARMEDSKGG